MLRFYGIKNGDFSFGAHTNYQNFRDVCYRKTKSYVWRKSPYGQLENMFIFKGDRMLDVFESQEWLSSKLIFQQRYKYHTTSTCNHKKPSMTCIEDTYCGTPAFCSKLDLIIPIYYFSNATVKVVKSFVDQS